MLFLEFLCLFTATLLLFIEIVLVIKPVVHSPIFEIKLFFIGMIILDISFSSYMLESFLADTTQPITNIINSFDRTGYFLSMIGLIFISYAFILPNFKLSYKNVFSISLITGIGSASGFVNGITSQVNINGQFLKSDHNIVGLLLNYIFIIILLYVIFRRINDISKIANLTRKKTESNFFLKIILLLFVISFVVAIITNNVLPTQLLPSYFYFIFIAIAFAFFIYFYLKDNAFFFLTPVLLDAIIIAHKKSGVTIYSESYKDNFRVEDMLSSVFSLLNISLQEFIETKKELEEISFGDKKILIVPGKYISSIIIVSNKNFIVQTLAKVTTTKFEKLFHEELEKRENLSIFDKNKFLSFKDFTKEIRMFLPL